jgi:hypothetical protein
MCVSATGTNDPTLIVVGRRRHGMGGYEWSTGGLYLDFYPGGWMQVVMFVK